MSKFLFTIFASKSYKDLERESQATFASKRNISLFANILIFSKQIFFFKFF